MNPITPAGHQQAIASKAYATETKSDLENAFLEFRSFAARSHDFYDGYGFAKNCIRDTAIVPEAAHSLLLQYQNEEDREFHGIFLSAVYTLCKENVIVHDLDVPLTAVGFCLPEDKLLVNTGYVGRMLGSNTEGVVINAGNAGKWFGYCGKTGLAIALREPESYESLMFATNPPGTRIQHDRLTGTLKSYVEEVVASCTDPAISIYQRYGEMPARKIKEDVQDLLGGDL